MKNIIRTSQILLATVVLLAASLSASAYEVHILTGQGSESKILDKGDYELAIERLELRIQRETTHSDIQLTNLCTAYVVTGQLDRATDVCDQAVAADGDHVGTAFNSRGVLKALQRDYIAAMEDFRQARIVSNYPAPRSNFGDQLPSMKRFSTLDSESDNSIQIAASNYDAADRTWASIREKATEVLTADIE